MNKYLLTCVCTLLPTYTDANTSIFCLYSYWYVELVSLSKHNQLLVNSCCSDNRSCTFMFVQQLQVNGMQHQIPRFLVDLCNGIDPLHFKSCHQLPSIYYCQILCVNRPIPTMFHKCSITHMSSVNSGHVIHQKFSKCSSKQFWETWFVIMIRTTIQCCNQ